MIKTNHVLPGKTKGDVRWFYRQNKFEQQEIRRQVAWKDKTWPGLALGPHVMFKDHFYPHILPDERDVFYPSAQKKVKSHFTDEKIALHSEVLNLKSSQVACINFLFPLKEDPSLATKVFNPFIKDLNEVIGAEFEYTGPDGITEWLGEPPRGGRGQNRTSIDFALFWKNAKGQNCATLIEWKYTERGCGGCSAYSNGTTPEQRNTCNTKAVNDPNKYCLLTQGGDYRHRHYWDHMQEAGIDLRRLSGLNVCPFNGPFYQIMRQFMVAAYMRKHGFDYVEVMLMAFGGNESIKRLPRKYKPLQTSETTSVIDTWNSTITGVSELQYLNVEKMMNQVDQLSGFDSRWRGYLRERYGI